jgi:hypothetical protein
MGSAMSGSYSLRLKYFLGIIEVRWLIFVEIMGRYSQDEFL